MASLFQQYSRFYVLDDEQQKHDQIVNVSDWPWGGDFVTYPEGTRPKYEVFCPDDIALPFLIPGHRYLYKKTIQRKSRDPNKLGYIHYEQFWVEIVAYHLGRALGVDIPPAFAACRELEDGKLEYACLIEWFYGYPDAPYAGVSRGGELMMQVIVDYDRDKGKQHNFTSIAEIFSELPVREWFKLWVRMLLFDALVGNTDRHQENWEVVMHFQNVEMAMVQVADFNLSPAFDNGTALGYEVIPRNLSKAMNEIDHYIARGKHHMKWQVDDEKQQGHFELLVNLISYESSAKDIMAELLHCDLSALYDRIMGLTRYDICNENYRLTPERAEFMIALLKARVKKAKETIGV